MTRDNSLSKIRNSNFEIIKILAILFIVIGHTTSTVGGIASDVLISDYTVDLRLNTWNFQYLFLTFCEYFGSLGNAVFMVSSSYFLLDSKETRSNKIIEMILDVFALSVISMIVYKLIGGVLSFNEIIKLLFPTTFSINWYITCYILLYSVHGWLNQIIYSLDKKQLFKSCLIMALLYCIINFVLWNCFEFSGLIGFVVIYFFTGYVKLHAINFSRNIRSNICLLMLGLICFCSLMLMTNILGLHFNVFANKMLHWTTFMNPFFIIMAIASINIAANIKPLTSKRINTISKTTLLIYVIHEGYIMRTYIRPEIFKWFYYSYGYDYVLPFVLIVAVLIFIFSLFIGIIYSSTLHIIATKISIKLNNVFEEGFNKLYSIIE